MKKGVKNGRKKGLKKRQKRQLALLTLVVLIASVAAIMLLTPFFNITEIDVHGNMHISSEDIIKYSGINKDVNIFSIDLDKAEDNVLASESRIASAKIERSLPNKVTITVVEEVGVAYLTADEGYVIITADGRCIDVSNGTETSEQGMSVIAAPHLPKIVGMSNVKYKVGKTVTSENEKQLQELLKCLRELTKQGYVFDVAEIDVTDTSDIKFYYQSRNLCVILGRTEKLDYKIACFGSIYKEYVLGKTKEGEMPSGYIDLTRPDMPTYRPKEEIPEKTDESIQKTQ